MALPGVRTAGTFGSGTGAVTPAAPTSIATGDLEVLIATTEPGQTVSITTLGGGAWTALPGTPVTQTAAEVLYVWWRIRQAGDGNPVVTPSSDHCTACRLAFSGVDPLTPIVKSAVSSEATSDTSLSFVTGISTSYKNCLVVCVATSTVDSNTTQVPSGGGALTNATLASVAVLRAGNTTSGSGGGFNATKGTLAATGSMGTWSGTYAGSSPKTYAVFEVRPAEAPKSGQAYSKMQGRGIRSGSTPEPPPPAPFTYSATGAGTGTPDGTRSVNSPPYSAPVNGADARTAINQAITDASAAGGYQRVTIDTSGTYNISGYIEMKNNVELYVPLGSTVTLKLTGLSNLLGGGVPVLTTNGASNTTVRAAGTLTVDGNGMTLDGNSINRQLAYTCEIRGGANNVFDSIDATNLYTYAFMAMNTSNFAIANCSSRVTTNGKYDQLDGIQVLDSNNGDVVNNDVDQRYNVSADGDDGLVVHTISATTHDVRFSGNLVRGGSRGNGMQFAIGNFGVSNITVSYNEFYGSPEGIRTGYYDAGTGTVNTVSIIGNNVHDLLPGIAFPTGGNAIEIGYFQIGSAAVTNVAITNNRLCNAGIAQVIAGSGNVIAGTLGCTDSPPRPPSLDKAGGAYTSGQASGVESVVSASKAKTGSVYSAARAMGVRAREATAKIGGVYGQLEASGTRAGSTLGRTGKAYGALQAAGGHGRDVSKAGTAVSALRASGTRAGSTLSRVGGAYTSAQASGVEALVRTYQKDAAARTGLAATGSRAGSTLGRGGGVVGTLAATGVRGREVAKIGAAYAAAHASGTRAGSTLNRLGKAYASLQAAGGRVRAVSKAGSASSAAQASGLRAGSTLSRAAAVYGALQASGTKQVSTGEIAKTGSAVAALQASGSHSRDVSKATAAYSAMQASATRAGSTLNRAGTAHSALQAGGIHTAGRDVAKTGTATSGLRASATRAGSTLGRAGSAYGALQAGGVKVIPGNYVKLGGATGALQASGARVGVWNRGGNAYGALHANATRRREAAKLGTATSTLYADGARQRTRIQTGTATSTLTVIGVRALTMNRTGTAYSRLYAMGVTPRRHAWPLLETTETRATVVAASTLQIWGR